MVRRCLVLLLAAGTLAGLQVETHECRQLVVSPSSPEAARLLCWIPCSRPEGDQVVITGWNPETSAGFAAELYPRCLSHDRSSSRCACALKTFVVPASDPDSWRSAVGDSPIGPASVVRSALYLGATVASRGDASAGLNRWSRKALQAIADGCWQRPGHKLQARAVELGAPGLSPKAKSELWNTYVASLLP